MHKLAQIPIGDTFFGGPHFLQNLPGLGQLVSILLSNAIVIAGVILIFIIIYAGITMINAGGNPQEIQRARQLIYSAIIGFIIVAGAFLIVRVIERATGVNILG